MSHTFDLIVIGAGPGGYPAALQAAAMGKTVAVVEQDALGGTCLNRGCIPTKTLLHATGLYHECKTAARFGVQCGDATMNYPALWAHKDTTLCALRSGIAQHFKKSKVTHITGKATVLDAHTVAVMQAEPMPIAAENGAACAATTAHQGNTQPSGEPACIANADSDSATAGTSGATTAATAENQGDTQQSGAAPAPTHYTAAHILIATGSAPATPPIKGISLAHVINSDDIFDRNLLGKTRDAPFASVIIIGGGVIGMEMATIYSNLGCTVTVLEGLDRILAGFDKEIAQNLKMILKKRGVNIITAAMVQEITQDGENLRCVYTEKDQQKEISAEGILISTGRKATTVGLFAPVLEAQLTFERGYLQTDEHFRTAVPSVYAIGDVRGKIQLAHMATAEGEAAVNTMFAAPDANGKNLALVPSCVYTEPEIACIGITADEAKAQGRAVIMGKYIMSVNGKSVLSLQERGFIKIVADQETRRVLGAQLMCARATDMIGELTLAIAAGLTLEQCRDIVRPHPTFAEGIGEAFSAARE